MAMHNRSGFLGAQRLQIGNHSIQVASIADNLRAAQDDAMTGSPVRADIKRARKALKRAARDLTAACFYLDCATD